MDTIRISDVSYQNIYLQNLQDDLTDITTIDQGLFINGYYRAFLWI